MGNEVLAAGHTCYILHIEKIKCSWTRWGQSELEVLRVKCCGFPWLWSYILIHLLGKLDTVACKKEDMEYIKDLDYKLIYRKNVE